MGNEATTVEIGEEKLQVQTIKLDLAQNVVTEWEERALRKGIAPEVRAYLQERLVSVMLDACKANDMTQLSRLQGRALEIKELLGLFKV